jgi:hypothetical protein
MSEIPICRIERVIDRETAAGLGNAADHPHIPEEETTVVTAEPPLPLLTPISATVAWIACASATSLAFARASALATLAASACARSVSVSFGVPPDSSSVSRAARSRKLKELSYELFESVAHVARNRTPVITRAHAS